MNKRYLRIVAFSVIAVVLTIAFISVGQSGRFASASENGIQAEKRFENDSVLITLTEAATRQFLTYTPESFPEIDCVSVEDLTQYTVDYVKDKIQGNPTEKSMMVDVEQFRRILGLELKEKTEENVLHAVEALQKREDILCAKPNYICTIASTTPNDWYYTSGNQWGLSRTNGIQAPAAWDIKKGSTVTVGVMDTGIQANHPDLFGMISTADLHRDCTVNPIQSVNYAYLSDPHGHGTHVAGIIGAEGDNKDESIGFDGGVSGVCWGANLVSLRVFDSNGSGDESTIARAIDFAQNNNIPILNLSGGISYDYNSTILSALMNYTGLFVCAAGNGNSDNDLVPNYPSDYSRNQTFSSRVISVGAINENGTRATGWLNGQGSNYGANSVSLFAPGDNIRSTYKNSQYAVGNGTSQAAPFVTGVAALILSINPNLTPAQVKSAIMNNVDTSSALTGLCVSNGRLNAFKAVSSVAYNLTNVGTSSIRIDSLLTSLKTTNTAITGPLSIPNTINGRTVNEIGSSAFVEARFTSLDIPSGVLSIASDSFEDCNRLNAINVASTNPNYSSTNGILYNKNCTTLLKYPASKSGSSFSVPASVTSIEDSAFKDCTNLQTVSLISEGNLTNTPNHPSSYTNYYYNERSLDVNLIAGSTYTLSFDYTNLTANTDHINVFTSLGVGNATFAVDLPVQKAFPSASSNSASTGSQKIVFTPTAAQLSTYTKLWCRFIRTSTPQTVSVYISNVKLERGVTDIDIHAFIGCTRLATPGLQYDLLANNTYAVSKGTASGTTLFIPSTYSGKAITQISASAFKNCTNFKWAFMQDSITTIGNRAFQFCYNLKTVDMNTTSVTRIEDYTFDVCRQGTLESELKHLYLPDSLTYVGEGAFIRTKIPAVLPNNVTSIGDYAFAYGVDRIVGNLPSSVQTIGNYAFADCEVLIMVYTGTQLATIGQYAFSNTLTTLETIPSSVTTIGAYAFCNSSFSSSHLALGGQLSTIGDYAFQNCQLTQLVLPTSVTNIGVGAFNGNDSLTIYTERTSRSSTWNVNWNNSNRPVVWGCTLSSDKTYVVSFTKTASNPSNTSAANGITNPFRKDYNFGGWYTTSDFSGTQYMDLATAPNGILYAKWNTKSCVAEGTMITLADGSQVEVEDLTGEELLLVWNLFTGTFDVAPILFIDSDPYTQYEIIHLYFSDGTEVKVIYEHGFWDIDLNEYVFLRNDAEQYIGHWFNKQADDGNGNMTWTAVQLVGVDIYTEYTTSWSPVTFGYLCYYVNGMLSMPGATEGLINIFEVDAATMQYDSVSFAADIATYGLFTYEEFAEIILIPEVIFEAFNGQYLKVSIGKGLITMEGLIALIERYADFFYEDTDTNGNSNQNGQDNGNHHGHNNGNGNHNGHGNGNHNGHGNGNHNGNGHGNGNHNRHRGRGR